ncbi:Penicillin-binding protein 1A [Escherichia coli]|uniref:Penicillin-binding protein 1A n=1 Tax=Escherichia coli TaxID=562 RepID=A0A377DAW5_ECOLX|nr:Penicillin-binding protein 1A [Escherichia coli]
MEGVRWARPYRSDTQQGPTPRKVTDVLQTGQQIWVRQVGDAWWLAQVPEVNSALVSINPQNGAVMALVGGFDFNQSKFNRRHPGTASGGFQHQTVPLHRGDG